MFESDFSGIIESFCRNRQNIFLTILKKHGRKVTFFPEIFKNFNMWSKRLEINIEFAKDIPEIKTFESSQQLWWNSMFMIIDYLPCLCKIPIQKVFWHKNFICNPISKIFVAHFTTNLWLNIGMKIFYLVSYKLKIIQENAFSEASFSTIVLTSVLFYRSIRSIRNVQSMEEIQG